MANHDSARQRGVRRLTWNHRAYGTANDPVHKSHLNAITGEDYGCPKKFWYDMQARAAAVSGGELEEQATISGKAAAGTAAHETIARALSQPDMRAHLLGGGRCSRERLLGVFSEEYEREVGGRKVNWYGKDEGNEREVLLERLIMIEGLLNDLHKYVAEVLLIEPGFVAKLEDFWLCGHVDLVYRPKHDAGGTAHESTVAICDWKTGAQKPAQIELDHGWEAGVYSTAVKQGYFFPREQIRVSTCQSTANAPGGTVASIGQHTVAHPSRYIAERNVLEAALIEFANTCDALFSDGAPRVQVDVAPYDVRVFGEFPSEVYHVHMADYVPYKKAGSKAIKRAEDMAWLGYERPEPKHKYVKGDLRGPAWLPVKLAEYDMPRLAARLRNVVGSVRMGRFIDNVGEKCTRCSYGSDCLTAGYAPRGDARKDLERSLRAAADAEAENDNATDDLSTVD